MSYTAEGTHRWLALAGRAVYCYVAGRPFCVSFEITRSCNARCKHCHLGGVIQEERAAPPVFGDRCRELKPLVAQISGGEPLLRSDLDQIVEQLRVPDRAPMVVITTNAALLTEARYHRLRALGVDEFSVSLDYPDDRHDEFRGVPGLFAKIERTVASIGPDRTRGITLSCVVQRDNFRLLPSLAELALDWGVKVNFSTYTPLRTDALDYMIPPEELPKLREIVGMLMALERRHHFTFTSEYVFGNMVRFFRNGGISGCRAGHRFLVVNPDGSLSPCGLIIGSFASQGKIRDTFSRTNSCRRCYTSIRANTEKPLRQLFLEHALARPRH